MTLPAGIEAFTRFPIWGPLFLMLAVGLALYGGWSWSRRRERADLYYALIGVYLFAVQLPTAVPAVGVALGITCPLSGDMTNRLLVAAPVMGLYVLAVRAR